MTKALSILSGPFGRVALLDMDTSLVDHAHHHCHLILKASGPDQDFVVEGRPIPVRDDTAVMVNSWQQHEYVHQAHEERTVFLALYIEPDWLAAADPAFAGCARPGFFTEPALQLNPHLRRLRTRLVQHIAFDFASDAGEVERLIRSLSLEAAHLGAELPGSQRRDGWVPRDFRIRRAIRHMHDHVGERPDLDGIARAAGLSRPHFNHLFRQATGVSPGVYGNALRVEAAVGALREGGRGLAAISDGLGFSAQSNFTRFFQQHTGAAPHQFRRVLAVVGDGAPTGRPHAAG